jgi:hypothetical protein
MGYTNKSSHVHERCVGYLYILGTGRSSVARAPHSPRRALDARKGGLKVVWISCVCDGCVCMDVVVWCVVGLGCDVML